jgi:exosome complex exonuclease DIS3/RRP44
MAELQAERRLQKETARKAQVSSKEKQPTGRIVGIVKRGWRSYVCHLDRSSLSPNALNSTAPQSVFATPLDRKIPKIRLRTRQASNLLEQKFLVSIDSWDVTSRHPEGHLVRALGKVETKEAEVESLLLEHDVPYRPFSKAILSCLPPEGDKWVVPPKSETSKAWKGREDLREMIICSIDPVGCQDIDDALHARQLPNGNIEAGVREWHPSSFDSIL